jgi:hypothetical protein
MKSNKKLKVELEQIKVTNSKLKDDLERLKLEAQKD